LKVLHINTLAGQGGAALLMQLLAEKTEKFGVENGFIVCSSKNFSNRNIFLIHNESDKKTFPGYRKITRILSENGFLYFFKPVEARQIVEFVNKFKPDIIHLHNTHGDYFQTNLIKKLVKTAPVIWTFHDMFPITGHCAYSFECEKWKTACGSCQNLEIYPSIKKDLTKFLWKYKKWVHKDINFTIVTPSKWLKKCVEQSFLNEKRIELIYNGIDLKKFYKRDKIESREKCNLPLDKKIILFSANGGVKNPFKGGEFVFDVYEKLKDRNDILFINTGSNNNRNFFQNWIDYGHVYSEEDMADLYSASDIYLFPTLADNCPLSVIESMACGLPVITFNTGGVPEIVEHMKNGYVADYKSLDDIFKGVLLLLDNDVLRDEFSLSAISRVKNNFDSALMVGYYFKLYSEILSQEYYQTP